MLKYLVCYKYDYHLLYSMMCLTYMVLIVQIWLCSPKNGYVVYLLLFVK